MLGDELGPYPQGARPGDSLDMKHAKIVTNKNYNNCVEF